MGSCAVLKIFCIAKPCDSMYKFCAQQITEYGERAKKNKTELS